MLHFKLFQFVPSSGNEQLTFIPSNLLYEENQPTKCPVILFHLLDGIKQNEYSLETSLLHKNIKFLKFIVMSLLILKLQLLFFVITSNRVRMGLKTALWPWKPCLVFCSPCADLW